MSETTGIMPDPALYGLEDRERGSACPSPCTPDCTHTCHERHKSPGTRAHDDYYCDQIRLGRDVSEYRPDIRVAWEAEKRAARARAEHGPLRPLFGRAPNGGWGA